MILWYSVGCGSAVNARSIVKNQRKQHAAHGAFKEGEELHFTIRYGLAKGAEARFKTTDTVMNGRKVYKHTVWGFTTGLVGAVYPLTDYYHSYTMRENDLPLRAIRNVHEQNYKDYKEDFYLYGKHKNQDSIYLAREQGDTLALPYGTHDMVSVVYYIRNQLAKIDLDKTTMIEIPTFFNGEYFPLAIRYQGKEKVKTRFGKIECYKFVPLVIEGDLFQSKDAITVWISACNNHVPVRVRFKVFIGSMYCDLVDYKGLSHPLWIQRK